MNKKHTITWDPYLVIIEQTVADPKCSISIYSSSTQGSGNFPVGWHPRLCNPEPRQWNILSVLRQYFIKMSLLWHCRRFFEMFNYGHLIPSLYRRPKKIAFVFKSDYFKFSDMFCLYCNNDTTQKSLSLEFASPRFHYHISLSIPMQWKQRLKQAR